VKLLRTPTTWYCYLLSGFFTFILNIQGNIIPLLREELSLSYRQAGLHPSAIAAGMIVAGFVTDRVFARLGRRAGFALAVAGVSAGALLLCAAGSASVSLTGCALIGLAGAMIPSAIAGVLAQLHGNARDQAFAECGAVTYACAIMANLGVGAAMTLALGWRAGVIAGVALGLLLVATLGRAPIPAAPPRPARGSTTLPAACWAYLATLGLGVAIEFSVLLWSPAFLETVAGLSKPAAAAGAAAFAGAMLVGRWAGSRLVRIFAPMRLYPASVLLTLPGFALYWGVATPLAALVGLFVIGLGVSMLYPLSLGFAVRAAGANSDAGGARSSVAAGIAILISPVVLGALADAVGLADAHLVIPALVAAILISFALARALARATAYAPPPALP
jgi:MFS transporter, DHA1 family, inner membrane transport protein